MNEVTNDRAAEIEASRTRRADRVEATAERRRRRNMDTNTDPSLKRFGLTERDVDLSKYVYRAAADDGMRLIQLTRDDDYDFVTADGGKSSKKDAAGVLKYQSGINVDGSPKYTYLLRKPMQFAAEDRKAKEAKIDALESARLHEIPSDAPDQSYTPKR